MEAMTQKITGVDQWACVTLHPQTIEELFDKRQIVYLSPDAVEPLTTIEHGSVYVIGGLCDRDRVKVCAFCVFLAFLFSSFLSWLIVGKKKKKNVTTTKAEGLGVRCFRLPIDESIKFKGNKVRPSSFFFSPLFSSDHHALTQEEKKKKKRS